LWFSKIFENSNLAHTHLAENWLTILHDWWRGVKNIIIGTDDNNSYTEPMNKYLLFILFIYLLYLSLTILNNDTL